MSKNRKRKRDRVKDVGGSKRVVERLIEMKVNCNFSQKQMQEIISLYGPEDAAFIKKTVEKELSMSLGPLV